MNEPLSPYEQRLLAELNTVVAERDAPVVELRSRRRLVVLGAGGTLAAGIAAAVSIVLVGGAAATPAYAVERDGDHVAVTIHDPSRLDGLDRDLAAQGVPAVIVPVTAGCTEPSTHLEGRSNLLIRIRAEQGGRDLRVELIRGELKPGEKLYFGQLSQANGYEVQMDITTTPRTCFPLNH